MTLREKLEIEHPECIGEQWHGGCKDCPHKYGYKEMKDCECDSKTVNDDICRKCWDQKYEGELTPQEKKIEALKKHDYYNRRSIADLVEQNTILNKMLHDIRDHVEEGFHKYSYGYFENIDSYVKHVFDDVLNSRNHWKMAFFVMLGITLGILWGLLA